MASGTIFSLALSQQFDDNGDPLGGCRLFIYLAGTTTPATTYQTSALVAGQENPFPIIADASGRIPPFWMDSAFTYKARLTDENGVLVFEYDNVPAIGPGVGGGGVDTTPADAIFSTGMVMWYPLDTTLTGWVRPNGRTIGNSTSGGTERANADCSNLFDFLWQNFSNTLAPVSGGRGASSAIDFAASKNITLPDYRGRALFGFDSMGSTASARLTGTTFAVGDKDTAGSTAGSNLHTITEAQMPSHTHTATSIVTDPGHTHTFGFRADSAGGGGGGVVNLTDNNTDTTNSNTTGITVATSNTSTGSGTAHNIMPPAIVGTYFMHL